MEKYCPICGQPVPPNQKIYCSNECWKKHRNLISHKWKLKNYPKWQAKQITCKTCGKVFIQKTYHQIYCSDQCREEYNKKYRQFYFKKKHVPTHKICPICNKEFIQTAHFHEYCSEECRNKAKQNKKKPELVERQCIICGKTFLSKSRTAKTCSDICYKRHRVNRVTKYNQKKQLEKRLLKEKTLPENSKIISEEMEKNDYDIFCEKIKNTNQLNKFIKYDIYQISHGWKLIVDDSKLNIVYDTLLNSNLLFGNYDDAIKLLYDIYKGELKYIDDYIQSEYGIAKPNKEVNYEFYKKRIKNMQQLKIKVKIPNYQKEYLSKHYNNYDFTVNYIMDYYNHKLRNYNYRVDKEQLLLKIYNNDYAGIEQYYLEILLNSIENQE